jgi:hypothetical protein
LTVVENAPMTLGEGLQLYVVSANSRYVPLRRQPSLER